MSARARPYAEVAVSQPRTVNEIYRSAGPMAEALDLCRLGPIPTPNGRYDVDVAGRPVMLYFMHNPITKMIKIGISVEVIPRMIALESACGCDLVLLGFNYGGRGAELSLHRYFRADRQWGEWFSESQRLFALAEEYHERGLEFVARKYRVSLP